ncbi:hypothetical protein GF339_19850 [candidate division KSB3 bacterium]|uniref:Carbohydrate kinase PfkB domain-containing protein n=1 Tax=candidate division KSB3 bacterium TaxID=2044937 RepID=A0A9D5Q7V6_9BACT|nr:hypothetical protein [candidate division KSB3 bacterium]MBD3326848.1 hypothetical protein [candidate division KSB3 bacterium]
MIPTPPDEVVHYLQAFRTRYSTAEVLAYLEVLKTLKVMVVGEIILDEYVYCEALGKSGKEAMLVMKYISQERYAGGVLAIANHLAEFCQQITLVSYLGDLNSHEAFVRQQLRPNITSVFVYKTNSPTIIKRRFLDSYTRSKLLGVYEINDEWLDEQEEGELCRLLEQRLPDVDLAIVADYDHGLITPKIVDVLTRHAPFLAINTQVNAANIGFHSISKYQRADFICTNENELRMDRRSRKGELEELVRHLSRKMHCQSMLITRGTNGTLLYRENEGFTTCPAFAVKVVDRIGAGDAVLALASLLSVRGIPSDVISFVGNVVGAEAVAIIGNKQALDKPLLTQSIARFLKKEYNM